MIGNQRGNTAVQIIWAVAGLVVIVAGFLFIRGTLTSAPVKFTTPYQAVLLTSGSAYFGRLEGYGTSRPVLNEVYYIVTQTNPETKQTNNILVKRGKEMHEPDRMYLNPSQIIAVEPVGPNSQIAQQIAKSQAQH
jgi:hypothetical protein